MESNFHSKLFLIALIVLGFVAGRIALADTPVVTSFVIPETSSSFTVPISVFTAAGGGSHVVSRYLISESSAMPSPTNPTWIPEAPSTFTFVSEGIKTLYAWVKDENGDISASLSDSVNINFSVPDDSAPAQPSDLSIQ